MEAALCRKFRPSLTEAGLHRAGPTIGADVFLFRFLRDAIRRRASGPVKEAEVDVLPPGSQLFGKVLLPMQAVVPAVVKYRRRAVALNRHIEDHHALHRIAVLRGQREGDQPAPVMADDEKRLLPEHPVHQAPEVVGHGLLVVTAFRPGGITQPADIGAKTGYLRERAGMMSRHMY